MRSWISLSLNSSLSRAPSFSFSYPFSDLYYRVSQAPTILTDFFRFHWDSLDGCWVVHWLLLVINVRTLQRILTVCTSFTLQTVHFYIFNTCQYTRRNVVSLLPCRQWSYLLWFRKGHWADFAISKKNKRRYRPIEYTTSLNVTSCRILVALVETMFTYKGGYGTLRCCGVDFFFIAAVQWILNLPFVAVISYPTVCDVCVKEMICGAVVFCLTILTPIAKRKRGDHDVACKIR